MIHFLVGFISASLMAGAALRFGYVLHLRAMRAARPIAEPGYAVRFYDLNQTTLRMVMVVQSIDHRLNSESTMSLIDQSSHIQRYTIPKDPFFR